MQPFRRKSRYIQKLKGYKFLRQSLYINLKSDYTDLKIKLHEQTIKHSELGMELKAEEEANHVFRTENV